MRSAFTECPLSFFFLSSTFFLSSSFKSLLTDFTPLICLIFATIRSSAFLSCMKPARTTLPFVEETSIFKYWASGSLTIIALASVVIFESSIYSPVVLPVREAQPENKANPKTTNTVKKITFFISLLLSLDVQSSDCNVNKSNSYIVISLNPYSVPDNYFQGQRAGST